MAQGHVVFASDNAVFGLSEVRIGLWPFMVYRAVEAAIGPRRTLELSLTGRTISANLAQEWGLVQHVCPHPETCDRARGVARELAKASPAAIESGLEYHYRSRGKSWEEAGQIASELRMKVMESEDPKEGFDAFKQKREPRWPSMPQEFYHKSPAPVGSGSKSRKAIHRSCCS